MKWILVTPIFWWMVIHPMWVVDEWTKTPEYFRGHIRELTSPERLGRVNEMRGMGGEGARWWFNKGWVGADEVFSLLTLLSPRIYFQAGDGSRISPPGVEPAPGILAIFWAAGIVVSLKKNSWRPFAVAVAGAVAAWTVGGVRMAFLLPVSAAYLFMVNEGAMAVLGQKQKWLWLIMATVCVYLMGRALWL
ncbi:MAG: hypothetical protein UX91_C0007G0029 [Candidatus Amesbacteria bacterium GW2011_GWB1_47_19]|nr:MAG: hypothetical protein UW51_C0006G0150 [Candidatus Amesbacteria bacterium GW2011_GWA1_44_24]KKU31813.1 MAG: hypothetical protein UX46_C0002G0029 [Candidatus Amesbacteria bacterium GW2011_GWC1_46_24]KKU66749.1 MAG: hypothetical protein UX91_C0007G0029 [Candidatus Amesbacteria bacterium GW2011_GWB1_47_19]OGD05045.1 MAG: hypothetical protein A2379_00530 [Candidatus Amesbacteria bacterium RIFOXYB1_FULL_47_13]HBC73115.1 hypothetical protein [Candidatus Amesbacteria bacterium]